MISIIEEIERNAIRKINDWYDWQTIDQRRPMWREELTAFVESRREQIAKEQSERWQLEKLDIVMTMQARLSS